MIDSDKLASEMAKLKTCSETQFSKGELVKVRERSSRLEPDKIMYDVTLERLELP